MVYGLRVQEVVQAARTCLSTLQSLTAVELEHNVCTSMS